MGLPKSGVMNIFEFACRCKYGFRTLALGKKGLVKLTYDPLMKR
jgi:hypothetical protein